MTSKEKLLQLRSDFYHNYEVEYDSIDYFNSILKDLEKLERYEEIFDKPFRDIRERLEELQIVKNWFIDRVEDYTLDENRKFFIDYFIREDEVEEKPMFDILLKWTKE